MAQRRIQKELEEFSKDPTLNCSAEPIDNDVTHCIGTINGPEGTPFEGGVFKLDIVFPDDYPFCPPHIKFITKVFHPNVAPNGTIGLNILGSDWFSGLSISKVLLSICSFLDDPNPNAPFSPDIAQIYKRNPEEYKRIAREWTQRYAKSE